MSNWLLALIASLTNTVARQLLASDTYFLSVSTFFLRTGVIFHRESEYMCTNSTVSTFMRKLDV